MKLRTGLVSNSSSSSFIVALPKSIKTSEDLQKVLFGSEKFYPNIYAHLHNGSPLGWPIEEVMRVVYNDFLNCKKLTLAEVETQIDDIAYPRGAARKQAEELASRSKDCDFRVFTYSDEDGTFMCALEHGPLFSRVPHITISNH